MSLIDRLSWRSLDFNEIFYWILQPSFFIKYFFSLKIYLINNTFSFL